MQASIQKITALVPIEGADKIEAAKVLGWTVVVKKGDFGVGDHCIFVEIDSVLPEEPWSEFMRTRHFRVKTAKLRGCMSQGLVLPTNIISGDAPCSLGDDVSAVLGITHYEAPVSNRALTGGIDLGPFPPVPKTDEVRLQSYLGLLEELRGNDIVVTVKVDGTSGTFVKLHAPFGPYKQGDFLVCSRNRCIRRPETPGAVYWDVADRYNLADVIPEGYAIQGEIAAPGVQRNRLEVISPTLFVFQVYNMLESRYLDYPAMLDFCSSRKLSTVPPVATLHYCDQGWRTELEVIRPTLEDFLTLADGIYAGTKNRREGIVVRPVYEMQSEVLGGARLSFKVVSNTYLLKDEA